METERAPDDGAILAGTEVLVLEDEFYLAFELKSLIERAGGRVAGPFPDAPTAIAHLDGGHPDCAVIDVNLGDGISYAAADALLARAVPFIFLTGYDAASLPDRFHGVDRIEKPAELDKVLRKLRILAGPEADQAAAR